MGTLSERRDHLWHNTSHIRVHAASRTDLASSTPTQLILAWKNRCVCAGGRMRGEDTWIKNKLVTLSHEALNISASPLWLRIRCSIRLTSDFLTADAWLCVLFVCVRCLHEGWSGVCVDARGGAVCGRGWRRLSAQPVWPDGTVGRLGCGAVQHWCVVTPSDVYKWSLWLCFSKFSR